jgi:Fe2+ transport system protein B|tara:strand:- start:316 stop:771 length:456 start_codon:yes stop_codon:yes gene_type:complete
MTTTNDLKTEIKDVSSMTGEDIERMMKAIIKMRETMASKEQELKAIKEQKSKLDAILIEVCRVLKSDSLKNQVGTLTRRVKKRYWTTDWPSMHKFIKDKELIEFMEKRLNQTNVKEYIADHPDELPPGLQSTSEYTVSVRKNRSAEEINNE